MNLVESDKLILPSIQRKYVCKEEQICKLFNSMMMWQLSEIDLKEKNDFYKLLNSCIKKIYKIMKN